MIMDLKQVPSDQIVTVVEIEDKNLAIELEIGSKNLELGAIEDKIRVLGDEEVRVENEIKGLKKKKKVMGFGEAEVSWEVEGEELSRVDELMVENKVLECERNAAMKEVEVWKQKCKDLEARLIQLEGRLNCQGQVGISNGILPMEGIPDKQIVLSKGTSFSKVHVRRQLTFQNEESCDDKLAPAPPTPSNVGIIDIIDSDNKWDVHGRPETDSQSLESSCNMSKYGVHEANEIMDEEENSNCDFPSNTQTTKKRRDFMVVMSDDEGEDHNYKRIKRALKVEDSDNEIEYDDNNNHGATPIRQLFNKVTIASDSDDDDDDDDNIPISQLKRKRDQGASHPRRRLVKHGKGEDEIGNHPEIVADDELSDDESEISDKNLHGFIVNDSDVENAEDDVSQNLEDNSCELEGTSDSELNFGEMISKLGSRRHLNSEWMGEGDMLADFGKSPELCMKAVCALYRQQTNEEKEIKASLVQNGRGFSKFDAERGTYLGEFLTNGDPNGDLVKSVEELREFDFEGIEDCHKFANRYSKQLFNIYEDGEDPFFL